MNRTKPREIFRLMKVGLTVAARRTAASLSLMSEAWVSAELLSNSTPIGSERKRQLNPLLGGERGGGMVVGGGQAWIDEDPGEEACKEIRPPYSVRRGSDLKYELGQI